MNEYQKRMLEGLERFSLALDAMTTDQLNEKINRSKFREKFQYYEKLEKFIFTGNEETPNL